MSGLVCVVSPSGPSGESPPVQREAAAVASAYVTLRGGQRRDLPATRTVAVVAVDAAVTTDARGWTVVVGTAHGDVGTAVRRSDVAALDGQFCLVSHDAATNRTLIATDRFAAAPVYVARHGGLLYVATSALALARHLRPQVSTAGVRNFLVSGAQFGPDTHWAGVRRLEPATVVEVRDGVVTEGSYWRVTVDPSIESLGVRRAADRLIELMVAVLKDRLGNRPTWVDLTGGYDSRLLALLLGAAGVPFTTNTRESTINADVEIAAQIAAIAGWPWEAVHYPPDWPQVLPRIVDAALAAGDGRLEVLQLSRVVWAHQRLARRIPHLVSAGGGEHLHSAVWIVQAPRPRQRRARIDRWVQMVALKRVDLDVLAAGAREATVAEYVDRLERWTAPHLSDSAIRRLTVAYAYQSSGHFGAYRAADDPYLPAQLPFYYEPFFTAAYSLRDRSLGDFQVMREMIDRLDHRVAAVPTTRGGPAVPMRAATLPRYLPYYASVSRKVLNRVGDKALGRPLWPAPRRFSWSEDDATSAVLRDLAGRGTIDVDHLRVRPFLSTAGAARLRDREMSTTMLGRLLTAEMALAATGTGT